MRGEWWQFALIALLGLTAALFGVFLYREIYPEYKIFQNTYVELEEFRSSITGEPPAPFDKGVQQIVLVQPHGAPEIIDRCVSCHVALKLTHFSPTKVALDVNGNVILDAQGIPVQEPNEDYIWKILDEKALLLRQQGKEGEAQRLEELKVKEIDGQQIDMSKALAMHPLIGRESRPFEFHPIEEYGCTVCHSGNGRSLTIDRAHGPVFDGMYEPAFQGEKPHFLELDPANDPLFSQAYNHKAGHKLLFQTTPILVGHLIESSCVQCHQTGSRQLQGALSTVVSIKEEADQEAKALHDAYARERDALNELFVLANMVQTKGLDETLKTLKLTSEDYTLTQIQRSAAAGQHDYIKNLTKQSKDKRQIAQILQETATLSVGNAEWTKELETQITSGQGNAPELIDTFVKTHLADPLAVGRLFQKAGAMDRQQQLVDHINHVQGTFKTTLGKENLGASTFSNIDKLTENYQRGQELFISQACYACHRIAGYSRGGVGPELTNEGFADPWFIKESIYWPQADLRTSTMPNMNLDHPELEDLTTFLIGQKGKPRSMSEVAYRIQIDQWEGGKKLPWEQPLPPSQLHDLDKGMILFATEGCAACHRLKGFESNVGFAVEKDPKTSWDAIYSDKLWFQKLFPEDIQGSELVLRLEQNSQEIDQKIVADVRKDSILEKIDSLQPEAIIDFYTPFHYALRAKNSEFHTEPEALEKWRQRVKNVMKIYVQEYGLGRLIGPRPNWSGIFRSDEWLMEHFYSPTSHTARSLMPVFPFDETKFYLLTYTLDLLSQRNNAALHEIWSNRGFNPELAYELQCAQCHGNYRQGDGPVMPWIYPIPKNLRNATFLRNLTKERVAESILYGVKGTPMPPWGETAPNKPFDNNTPVLNPQQTKQLVDWLFLSLPGGQVINESQEPPKWKYEPEDFLKELKDEGAPLKSALFQPRETYYAAITPEPQQRALDVKDLFDIRPALISGVEQHSYFIQPKYYTPQNLTEGERFFIENCSVCHGKEGAGNGARAGSMIEAKPRMLTNLDWIATRDDLRLLRSIKYGVPGTSMIPWGDQTSALQRMQLVMYIRKLSHENELRQELAKQLYSSFATTIDALRGSQIHFSKQLQEAQKTYDTLSAQRQELDRQLTIDPSLAQKAVAAYQAEVQAQSHLSELEKMSSLYDKLMAEVRAEEAIYQKIGQGFLSRDVDDSTFQIYIHLLASLQQESEQDSGSRIQEPEFSSIAAAQKTISEAIEKQIETANKEKQLQQGRMASVERNQDLDQITQRINSLTQLKNQFLTDIEEAKRIRLQQQKTFQELRVMSQRSGVRSQDSGSRIQESEKSQRHNPVAPILQDSDSQILTPESLILTPESSSESSYPRPYP